ncbi:MAG: TonB-dependent receptor [Pseudomonadota bacterium]
MTETSWLAAAPLRRNIHSKTSRIFIAVAINCAAIQPVIAQPFAQDVPDEITVSAMRAPTLISQTGSSVSLITSEDIAARQYAYLSDALRDAASVAIARNGGVGGVSSARIRGAASGQTLVVIDGVVVNDPAAPQGGFNFANLDAADIDRVEILRGPQSLLYGADAIGGVIAITTKRQGAGGFIEGGSFGTVRANAALAFENAGHFGRLSITGARTNGISRADGGAERDGFRTLAGSALAGAQFSDHWRGEITIRASASEADIDGFPPPDFALADTTEIEQTKDLLLAGRLLQSFDGFDGALSVSYNLIDRENRDSGASIFTAKGDRLTADYLAAIRLEERWRLIAGAEVEKSAADVSGVDESVETGAVFALVEFKPTDAITVSAGGRRDEFSNFEGATTARVAGVWNVLAGLNVRASWGEGFRAPTLFELNFDQFGVVPNPDLRPERARGFDIGIEKLLGRDNQHRLAVSFFRTRVRDQIAFDSPASGYFNIAEARSRGVEVEGSVMIRPELSLDLTYSYTDAINTETGLPLLRQPKHKGAIIATYQPTERLSISASGIFNGRESDIPSPNNGFIRLDLRAAFALSEKLEVYGRVENVTDTDYQDISGYGEAGAAAYGGLRVRL